MKPITYYVQTPAIDALVLEYGERLEVMTPSDRLSFLGILVRALTIEQDDPDGTDKAIQAWWLVADEYDATLTALIAAIATIQLENLAGDRLRDVSPPDLPL